MITLKRKALLSTVVAMVLMGGCGSVAKQDNGENRSMTAPTSTAVVDDVNISQRSAYTDETSDEDLNPDFIDPDVLNGIVEDHGCKTYEDGEDGSTSGWGIYDSDPSGAQIANVEMDGSHVIALNGDGIRNGFFLRRDNGDFFNNRDADTVQWRGNFSDDFIVFVSVLLDNGSVKYLSYSPNWHPQINDVFPFTLPEASKDGNWHTYTRDLQQDLENYLSGRQIESILDFQVRGSGYLDDIALLKSGGCDSNGNGGNSGNGNGSACDSGDNCQNSSIDLRYKVSLDIDYALKINGAQNADLSGLPGNIAAQIQAILDALQNGGSGGSTTGGASDPAQLLAAAQEVLDLAQSLLQLSENIPADASSEYIQAMLRLSDDIGKMADRIGEMADRILETEDKIVVVALRMLDSIDKAQESLLQAQQNFNDMLQIILGGAGAMQGQLADLMSQLQAAIAANDPTQIASIMQAIQAMLGGMAQLPSSILNSDMMTQMMTMMQQMMTQMMQGGFTAMNTGMEQFGQMMQQFIAAMADPNSGMSPVRIAEEMMGTIEHMMEMSKELLEKSMETGHSQEAIQAMQGFSQFLQNMADKALVAMDKMVTMGGMAQDVAFRMLDLMQTTETNLLQAQTNFNNLILGLAGQNGGN